MGLGLFGRCIFLISLCSLFGVLGLLGSLLGDLNLLVSGLLVLGGHFPDLGLLCGLFWTPGLLGRYSFIGKLGSIFETLVLLSRGSFAAFFGLLAFLAGTAL